MTKAVSLVVLLALSGCSTTADKAIAVVVEGRALLRHPDPRDSDWQARRAIFLADADAIAPPTSGSK